MCGTRYTRREKIRQNTSIWLASLFCHPKHKHLFGFAISMQRSRNEFNHPAKRNISQRNTPKSCCACVQPFRAKSHFARRGIRNYCSFVRQCVCFVFLYLCLIQYIYVCFNFKIISRYTISCSFLEPRYWRTISVWKFQSFVTIVLYRSIAMANL